MATNGMGFFFKSLDGRERRAKGERKQRGRERYLGGKSATLENSKKIEGEAAAEEVEEQQEYANTRIFLRCAEIRSDGDNIVGERRPPSAQGTDRNSSSLSLLVTVYSLHMGFQ